jgi:hypothetical protein
MRRASLCVERLVNRARIDRRFLMKSVALFGGRSEYSPGPLARGLHVRREILARMRGPGGYYNTGNLLGLATGIVLQFAHAPDGTSAAGAVGDYLAGDVSAVMLTIATLVFMASGEAYHRAWANGCPPDPALNRLGDFSSGVGAMALGAGLLMLGLPILAATSGLLHAFGKFGSALHRPDPASSYDWPWIFRAVVIESRVPAILAALIELARLLPGLADGGPLTPLVTPAALLICYLVWTRADFLLLKA